MEQHSNHDNIGVIGSLTENTVNSPSGSMPSLNLKQKIINIIEVLSQPRPGINQKQLIDELTSEQNKNYKNFLLTLSNISMDESLSTNLRMLCVIQLKNSLYSKQKQKMIENQNKWICIEQDLRNKIFSNTFQLLKIKEFSKVAPLCLSHLCVMEHQNSTWKDLVMELKQNVTNSGQDTTSSKQSSNYLQCASLSALGFISKEMHEYFDSSTSHTILSAVSFGLSKENLDIKLVAANTLFNVLDVVHEPCRDKNFREQILQMIISINDIKLPENIRIISYACLVKIADVIYEYIGDYIQGLFKITLDGMNDKNNFIIMYSIEFWRTICQKDFEAMELKKLTDNKNSNITSANSVTHVPSSSTLSSTSSNNNNTHDSHKDKERLYSYHALPHIIMILLKHLEGDAGEHLDGWTPFSSTSHFLRIVSKCWGSTVLEYVGTFFTAQIVKDEWYCKNSAVMALGAILDGLSPEQVENFIPQIWEFLLQLLYHPNYELRDTTGWLIGELARVIPNYVICNCAQLIPLLIELLKDSIKIAKTISLTLTNIINAYRDIHMKSMTHSIPDLNQFTSYFSKPQDFIQLVQLFILNTERQDDSLAIASFNSISYIVKLVGKIDGMHQVGLFIFETCLFHLEKAIKNSHLSLISAILLTIHSIIEDYGENNKLICHHTMNVLIKMDNHLSIQKLEILSDVISLITLTITHLSAECKPYMSICVKVIMDNICDFEYDPDTCRSTLSLLSILASYCPVNFFEIITESTLSKIMLDLKQIVLSSHEETFPIKHLVLDCYGDLIMANSERLFQYSQSILDTVLMALGSEFDIDNDVFQYKYAIQIYYSCMNSLCSLIQAYNNRTYPNNCQFIIASLPDITKHILRIANTLNNDEDIQIALTGLIGDLSKYFPSEMVSCFRANTQTDLSSLYDKSDNSNPIKGLNIIFERAKMTDNEQLKNIYHYTARQLKRAKIELIIV